VAAGESGSSLLEYLGRRFTYLRRGEWLDQIAAGNLSVNGALGLEGQVLEAGDLVAFDSSAYVEPELELEATIRRVWEDVDFLIVDKKGSLPCHPGGSFFKRSLWYLLREAYGSVHIATRLDRETSGLVLVCKSPEAARFAQGLLSSGSMQKSYLVLVHGHFPDRLAARGYLTKDESSLVRKKRRFVQGELPVGSASTESCETDFELMGSLDGTGGDFSLVLARPRTGRTHQIRASLFSLGYPVVGDKLYGRDEGLFLRLAAGALDEEDSSLLILPNQALHCCALAFISPAGLPIMASSLPEWASPFDRLLAQVPFLR